MGRQANAFLAIGAALALGAGAARAQQQQAKAPATGQAGGEAQREITGRILEASPSKLFVDHMGAVVQFNIAPDAQFSGGNVQSSKDLAPGQEIRASFTIENNTTNVAKRISVTSAGAAGAKQAAPGGTSEAAPGGYAPGEQGAPGTPSQPKP